MGSLGALLGLGVSVVIFLLYSKVRPIFEVPPVPELEEKWWGPGDPREEDSSIKPFKMNVSNAFLIDLNERLANHLLFQEPLEGVVHNYGINTHFLKTIIDFWNKKYHWREREEYMNRYPQYRVSIQGLNIHYIHVKPNRIKGFKVLPMLVVHGWPSSVREFYEIIPFLTTRHKKQDFVFEVIIPSLPGFGFSDAAVRPGLSMVHTAVILKNLMKRLGFEKFYLQGGGTGGIVTQYLAILFPEHVIGVHSNFCFVYNPLSYIKLFFASFYPSLVVSKEIEDKVFPLSKIWAEKLLESGYVHIQATKPDTIGVALRDSPVGLAAYIIEKFITWSNPEWKNLEDGGLTLKYTYTSIIDNIMIYWITSSITTSMRLFAEHFDKDSVALGMDYIPISKVPSGCMRFWHDIMVLPDFVLREKYHNLVHITDYETGHFAALEVPALLAEDIFQFVEEVENITKIA